MLNKVIIAVDISGSTARKLWDGDSAGNLKIQGRLNEVEKCLYEADPTLKRAGTPAGDKITLVGTDLPALVRRAVEKQDRWKTWKWRFEPIPVRIAFGYGQFEWSGQSSDPALGVIPDLVCSLADVCDDGKVATTVGVHEHLRGYGPDGFAFKLEAKKSYVKGHGVTNYYQSNGQHAADDKKREHVHVTIDNETITHLLQATNWLKAGVVITLLSILVMSYFATKHLLG